MMVTTPRTKGWNVRPAAIYAALILLMLFALAPLMILGFNSLKTLSQVSQNPISPPVDGLHWDNYVNAWEQGHYATTVRNSAIVTAATVLGVLIVSGLAAYSLARLRPWGANGLTMYFLIGTSLPAQLFLVPLFFVWAHLGLVNNLLGVIIIYWATLSPFATFLLRSFMVALPSDFEDAARLDGASEMRVLWDIIRPLAWPGFMTAGLITGLAAWNEFLFALTFLQRDDVKTITASLFAFNDQYQRDWALTSAASVLMILPVLVLFLALQRRFIAGLTVGGLKS
jgi:raffinose/stachyose/melibiose transport system permease protein